MLTSLSAYSFLFFFFLDGDKISSRAYAVLTQWLSEFDLVDTNGGPFELKYAFPVLFHCQWEICVPIQNTSGCRVPNTWCVGIEGVRQDPPNISWTGYLSSVLRKWSAKAYKKKKKKKSDAQYYVKMCNLWNMVAVTRDWLPWCRVNAIVLLEGILL